MQIRRWFGREESRADEHPQQPLGRLQDRAAIVTGAASGIGRATVARFLREGASVLATDIDLEALKALEAEVEGSADRLVIGAADVAQRSETETVVREAVARFGQLDILVNSAGIAARSVRAEADFEERWDAVMRVNAKGTLLMCHAAVEAMRRSGSGAIVNLASVMGVVGYPLSLPFSEGFDPYPHSKGAVIQMTRDMGVRLAPEGIRVNAVCPGFVYSALTAGATEDAAKHATIQQLHPMGRLGEPEEIANVITFLASEEASFVTAAAWMVDGGFTAV